MNCVFKNGNIYRSGAFIQGDLLVSNGVFAAEGADVSFDTVFNSDSCFLLPGLADVHVHLREPGFLYKETIATGSKAAARGGYTTVFSMPNLNPAPDCMEALRVQLDAIERDACIRVVPYGTITVGQNGERLSDMDAMAPYVCAFSDDGRGVQNADVMRAAMLKAKSLGKMIVAHCEDNSLLFGGYIHDGGYARAHGHRGICSESEWGPIRRDLELVRETGCSYHVCHISTKESVALIRQAKREGLDVSCETGPHYLLMNDSMLREEGRFKMNPPIRSRADQEALIEGIMDGTIDMIATDHAPHSAEEKGKGLEKSLMGVVGIETAFPLMYTHFVRTGAMSLERLVELMHVNPLKRFGLKYGMNAGDRANFTVYDLSASYEIDPAEFVSMGKSTPFAGEHVYGCCRMTVSDGKIAWTDGTFA